MREANERTTDWILDNHHPLSNIISRCARNTLELLLEQSVYPIMYITHAARVVHTQLNNIKLKQIQLSLVPVRGAREGSEC